MERPQTEALAAVALTLRQLATLIDTLIADRPRPEPSATRTAEASPTPPPPARASRRAGAFDGEPTTGRAFYLWLKAQSEEHQLDLVKEMTGWTKGRGWGHQFSELKRGQVAEAVEEARRRIDGVVYS